jgi:hypothetical protein
MSLMTDGERILDAQDEQERREARQQQQSRRDLKQAAAEYAAHFLAAAVLDGVARTLEAQTPRCTRPHAPGHTGLRACAMCRRFRAAWALAVAPPRALDDGDYDTAREDDCRG